MMMVMVLRRGECTRVNKLALTAPLPLPLPLLLLLLLLLLLAGGSNDCGLGFAEATTAAAVPPSSPPTSLPSLAPSSAPTGGYPAERSALAALYASTGGKG